MGIGGAQMRLKRRRGDVLSAGEFLLHMVRFAVSPAMNQDHGEPVEPFKVFPQVAAGKIEVRHNLLLSQVHAVSS